VGAAAICVTAGALAAATAASGGNAGHAHAATAPTVRLASHDVAGVLRRPVGALGAVRPARPPAAATRSHHDTAAPVRRRPDRGAATRTARAEARKVLALAQRLRGRPYVWGAAGPHAFDCSGLVQYVFRHALGLRLPRSTWSQWKAVRHIHRAQLKPGDLVYLRNLSHVGIYAGKGYWWVAPHTGARVKKQRIWTRRVMFARVIAR
jgi:cell wall-associated NlpC family hydrolase